MPLDLLFSPYAMLVALSMTLALVLAHAVSAAVLERQRRRYPVAVEWENVGALLDRRRRELAEADQRLAVVNRQIAERDRIGADVAAMQERLDGLRMEFEGLGDARQQIDAVKRLAADAATELAKRQDDLEAAGKSLDALRAELDAGREARRDLQGALDELDRAVEARKAELGRMPADLAAEVDRLTDDLRSIQRELDEKRVERGLLVAERSELAELATRKASVAAELSSLEAQRLRMDAEADAKAAAIVDLERRRDDLRSEIDSRRIELNAVRQDLGRTEQRRRETEEQLPSIVSRLEVQKAEVQTLELSARDSREAVMALNREYEAAASRLEEVRVSSQVLSLDLSEKADAIGEMERQLASVAHRLEAQRAEAQALDAATREARDAVSALRREQSDETSRLDTIRLSAAVAELDLSEKAKEADTLNVEIVSLSGRREAIAQEIVSLSERRESIAKEIEGIRGREGPAGRPEFTEDVIMDLRGAPAVLRAVAGVTKSTSDTTQTEEAALHKVTEYLKNLHLAYPERSIRAFHTALKINDFSQLTVLAGVSGTGKSLLPRRYAEAMGIRFLPIAVEPRWDSPQDLLGFYNYIEKRFRATDLARTLVHLDPHNTSRLAEEAEFRDDVMIVLLDEMNLARVEYYFSEFLSRLEARPHWRQEIGEEERRNAMITIDIQGRPEEQVNLYPPHNLLFVGTMNDDESTQALSYKVLDRGNIMQFAAPSEFAELGRLRDVAPPTKRLSFERWRSWIRSPASLSEGNRHNVKEAIKTLAKIMDGCGRPFGHRLNAAITAYVANYPSDPSREADIHAPLADQVEMRILPKLRGLNLEDHARTIDRLRTFIRDDLRDERLAERLTEKEGDREANSGLFNWRGVTRS